MQRRATLLLVLIAVLVIVGGYFAYDYLTKRPPSFLIDLVTNTEPPPPLPAGPIAPLTVPDGWAAYIYSRETPAARVMVRDPKGTLLVSSTKEGKVFALPDLDSDGMADRTITVLEGLRQPHGLLVRCPDTGNTSADQDGCTLYVAETGALKSYRYDADTYVATYVETLATFPTGGGHYTRTLLSGPESDQVYISVGSSCNVCRESNPMRATLQVLSLTDNSIRTFATGLRNTVFMAFHPRTGDIWGTDNGRDMIGDDIPPDEVNIIRDGEAYGWPHCYGWQVPDTDFDGTQSYCASTTPSHIDLPAHGAALGLSFVPEEGWPAEWQGDLLVALHGSWNRSDPAGYKVIRIDLDGQGSVTGSGITDFVTGFLAEGADTDEAIGRPADVRAEANGVVYVTDDRAGAVYRIQRTQ